MDSHPSLFKVLLNAREVAAANQPLQLARLARALNVTPQSVEKRLDSVLDKMEVRVTRSMTVGRYLLEELQAGMAPMLRSVFETNRQDHTEDSTLIVGVIEFRRDVEQGLFGAGDLPESERPRYGFAYVVGTPTEPFPFGPVRFVLNLQAEEIRRRVTFTPVDSSIPGLSPEVIGTLDHPLNAFARSSDFLIVAGLIADASLLPLIAEVWDNRTSGVPEAQIWGPLEVTMDSVQAIVIQSEAAEAFPEDYDALQAVAQKQGIRLVLEEN